MGLTENGRKIIQVGLGGGYSDNKWITPAGGTSTNLYFEYMDCYFYVSTAEADDSAVLDTSTIIAQQKKQNGMATGADWPETSQIITVSNTTENDIILRHYGSYFHGSSVTPIVVTYKSAFPEPITVAAGESKVITCKFNYTGITNPHLTRNGYLLVSSALGGGYPSYNWQSHDGNNLANTDLGSSLGSWTFYVSTEEANTSTLLDLSTVKAYQYKDATGATSVEQGGLITKQTISVTNSTGSDMVLKHYGTYFPFKSKAYITSKIPFPEPITIPNGETRVITCAFDYTNI